MTNRATTTRLSGPGLVAWLMRAASKVMCAFPWLSQKPDTAVTNTSGACASSMKVIGGMSFVGSTMMNAKPPYEVWVMTVNGWAKKDGAPNVLVQGRAADRRGVPCNEGLGCIAGYKRCIDMP